MIYQIFVSLIIAFSARESTGTTIPSQIVTAAQNLRKQLSIRYGKCEDTQGSLSLNFRNVGLRRIDSDFTKSLNVSCLSLENNEIDYVSPNAFRLMPNLLYLNLARNNLSLANFSQLDGHFFLRTLILDQNNPLPIENFTLSFKNKFPRLRHLYLRANHLKDISSIEFAPILINLYLSSNNLSASGLSFLSNAPHSLISLDLSDNGIESFDASKLISVCNLWLNNNLIKRLCAKCQDSALILKGLTRLQRLYLSNNRLTSIEPDSFDDTQALVDLDLSYNQIDSIRKNTFENMEMLRNLSLKGNLLSEMPDLYNAENLQYLSLASNQLQVVKNDSLLRIDKLRLLDLSNNKIRVIEAGVFAKKFQLEVLQLSNNKLVSFPSMWLTPITNLRILHVDGNQLRKLDDLKLSNVKYFARLEHVYLKNNLITKFQASSLYNISNKITIELFDLNEHFNRSQSGISLNTEACKCDCDKIDEDLISLL